MTDRNIMDFYSIGRLLNLHITLPKAITFGTQDITTLYSGKDRKKSGSVKTWTQRTEKPFARLSSFVLALLLLKFNLGDLPVALRVDDQ